MSVLTRAGVPASLNGGEPSSWSSGRGDVLRCGAAHEHVMPAGELEQAVEQALAVRPSAPVLVDQSRDDGAVDELGPGGARRVAAGDLRAQRGPQPVVVRGRER